MAVNQPPINPDIVESSWQYEVTDSVNANEQTIEELRELIEALTARVETLEGG